MRTLPARPQGAKAIIERDIDLHLGVDAMPEPCEQGVRMR